MNVLIVHVHPEAKSLTSSLKDFAVEVLTQAGHSVQVSDLYTMNWKSQIDGEDFLERLNYDRLDIVNESGKAFSEGSQTSDVIAEQEKLRWADAVIFQFSYWWFSMPAIMKGWVDRVFACGFAYGIGGSNRWRYGEGNLKGKRAMLSITIGGPEKDYSARGINGAIDDLLFPIHHGILFFPGMSVLPPFLVHSAGQLSEAGYGQVKANYRSRLLNLFITKPIPFRNQNDGDYDEAYQLKPGLEGDRTGLKIHQSIQTTVKKKQARTIAA
ncbi:MAG: NAD(P)H-dependent oxidoreductase [Leptolyngbyaceae cyanobacterium SM1_4_3]|nr:NAD(P)H-dependent oxidoreductase [Leptolyngbyaceae cyanobacterium SM1_4_3]